MKRSTKLCHHCKRETFALPNSKCSGCANFYLENPEVGISKNKNYYIQLFRKENFNCFPIPVYLDGEPEPKKADIRYKGRRTIPNQEISENENYGYIANLDSGNCTVDFDDERFTPFIERRIAEGYLVSKTGKGHHLPIMNLSGNISKIELFDYSFSSKKVIEIQGYDHYCMGIASEIFHDKLKRKVTYQNIGGDKIFDVNGMDFHEFVDWICKECEVEGKRKKGTSAYQYLRKQFLDGRPSKEGDSNNYFHQVAMVCNTDKLTREEAIVKIRAIFDKWPNPTRSWSNIEYKINRVYDNDEKITIGRKPKEEKDGINRTKVAQGILAARKIYSNVKTHEIFENKDGFLEPINDTLKKELYQIYPEIEKADQDSILFKLESGAKDIPETDKSLIVFPNGVYDTKSHALVETDKLADMGFRNYNYLAKSKENEPTEFMKILFENVPENEHKRIKAGLRAIFNGKQDPRISIIVGDSRVGKSTALNILCLVLGKQYAYPVTLSQFLEDRATRAHIHGKRLVVFQDIPEEWKEFSEIKQITGEEQHNLRGFQKDNIISDNKLKIWASGNYLPVIKDSEKNAMYTARLSVVHNTRKKPYPENPELASEIKKSEGEKIISWIINLTDEECGYEDSETVRREWEEIASPEILWLETNYQPCVDGFSIPIITLINECSLTGCKAINISQMRKSMNKLGYSVKDNIVKHIENKPKSKQ